MIHIKTTHHPFGSSFPPTCTTRCFHFTLFTCLPVSLVACIFCSPLLSCCFWPPLCFLPHTCPAPLCKLFCLLRLSPTLSDCHKISVSASFFPHLRSFSALRIHSLPPQRPQVAMLPSSSFFPSALLVTLCPLFLPAPHGSEGQGSNSSNISYYSLHEMTVLWDPAFSR